MVGTKLHPLHVVLRLRYKIEMACTIYAREVLCKYSNDERASLEMLLLKYGRNFNIRNWY